MNNTFGVCYSCGQECNAHSQACGQCFRSFALLMPSNDEVLEIQPFKIEFTSKTINVLIGHYSQNKLHLTKFTSFFESWNQWKLFLTTNKGTIMDSHGRIYNIDELEQLL